MNGHTKEPWKVFRSTDGLHVLGIGDKDAGGITDADGGLWRSGKERAANADRIVACVNALATIPDPEAYMKAARGMREALGRIATVDMGGGFLGAQACRQVASEAILAFDAAQGEQ